MRASTALKSAKHQGRDITQILAEAKEDERQRQEAKKRAEKILKKQDEIIRKAQASLAQGDGPA